MIFKEALIQSLSFAVRLSRFPTCATHLFAFLWKRHGRGGFRGSGSSREGVGLAANIPMTIHAAPFFSLLPLEGGAPKERRLVA